MGWQEVVAMAAVALAVAYLLRRVVRVFTGKPSACGACPTCSAAKQSADLVQIDRRR